MTATVRLTDQELAELKALTKKSNVSAAVRLAIIEYIRYTKRMRLKKLAGKVTMQNNWKTLEDLELDSQDERPGSH